MFNNTPVEPAAQGDFKVREGRNNNYEVKVNRKNLAELKRLTPRKKQISFRLKPKATA